MFTAYVDEFYAQTKTALAPGNYVVWSAGDRLAIFQGSAIADEYKLVEGSEGLNGGSFQWVAKDNVVNDNFNAGTELPCNVAFYPYSQGMLLAGDMEDGGKKTFTLTNLVLPEVQTYVANSFGNGAFPMVAVTQNMDDHNLKFKNIGGALKLQLKGSCVVKSIKVEGMDGEKLSGAATVTANANNQAPAIKMASDASTFVMLDCVDGVQLNEAEATNFYIALPPVVFANGFVVTVTAADEKEYTVDATDANTVLRSSILVMPEITIESEEVENPESGSGDSGNGYDYVDEYGINHGPGVEIDGVVWAPVNCGYHETDYKWGKLYQWGRKYGQGYDGSLYDVDRNVIGSVTDATVPELSEGGVSLQGGQSENNKNVFYTCTDFPYDWLYSPNDALWNSGTEDSPVKTEYDPCPTGWRVPTDAELRNLKNNYSSWTSVDGQLGIWFSGSSAYSSSAPQLFLPAAGYNGYGGYSNERGCYGLYWSSSPYDYHVYSLGFRGSDIGMGGGQRASGRSVRCVQE